MVSYDQDDLNSMALCVWKEARGEGDLGMQAVACVIHNRAADWFPGYNSPLFHTIFYKNQFTSMSVPSDPEFNLEPPPGDPQYAYCLSIVEPILQGKMPDVTEGAHYYCNPAESTSGWFARNVVANTKDHPLTATIGRQLFYK